MPYDLYQQLRTRGALFTQTKQYIPIFTSVRLSSYVVTYKSCDLWRSCDDTNYYHKSPSSKKVQSNERNDIQIFIWDLKIHKKSEHVQFT